MYRYLVEHQFSLHDGRGLGSEAVAVFDRYDAAEKWVTENNGLVQCGTLRIIKIPENPDYLTLNDIYEWTNPEVLYEGAWLVR